MGTVQSAEVHVAIACTTNMYRVGGHLTGITGTVQLTDNGSDPLSLSGRRRLLLLDAARVSGNVRGCRRDSAGDVALHGHDGLRRGAGCRCHRRRGRLRAHVLGRRQRHRARRNRSRSATTAATTSSSAPDGTLHVSDAPARRRGVFTSRPPGRSGQQCTIANGDGTIAAADVTNVAITCADLHSIGGTVTGLLGGTLVLEDNNKRRRSRHGHRRRHVHVRRQGGAGRRVLGRDRDPAGGPAVLARHDHRHGQRRTSPRSRSRAVATRSRSTRSTLDPRPARSATPTATTCATRPTTSSWR